MATWAWTHGWVQDGQDMSHTPVNGGNVVQGISSCLHQGWLGCALLSAPQRAGTGRTSGVAHVVELYTGQLHTCRCTCTHMYMCMCCVCLQVSTSGCACTDMHLCANLCVEVHVEVHTRVCTQVHVCLCIHAIRWVCMRMHQGGHTCQGQPCCLLGPRGLEHMWWQ